MSTETHEGRQFAREIKFLIPAERAAGIRDWARANLEADPHAEGGGDQYRVTSLYFDTPNRDVFFQRGSFARSKYRIRRYDAAHTAFLERKLKTRDLVSKRRSLVGIEELPEVFSDPGRDNAGYWFQRRLRLRGLEPVCQISYLRTARVGMNSHGPIRLTIDHDLRALPVLAPQFSGPAETGALLTGGEYILELKYRYQMPTLFKALAEQFALTRQAVSKYRLAAMKLNLGGAGPNAGLNGNSIHA